jgi:hypothetical protein
MDVINHHTIQTSHVSLQSEPRSEDNFQTQNNNSKSWKALPIDTKDRNISWTDLNGFTVKPEMYFFRPKCEKNKYFLDVQVSKNQCQMFNVKSSAYIQLYFETYTLKYKYWNEGLVFKHGLITWTGPARLTGLKNVTKIFLGPQNEFWIRFKMILHL